MSRIEMERDGDRVLLTIVDQLGQATCSMAETQVVRLADDLLRTVLDRSGETGGTQTDETPDDVDQKAGIDAPTTGAPAPAPVPVPVVPPTPPEPDDARGGVSWPAAWDEVPDAEQVDITPTALRYAADLGFTRDQIVRAASDPEWIEKLAAGDFGHHRGPVLAIMAADDRRVVKGVMAGRDVTPAPDRSGAASGGPGRAWPSSAAELRRALEAHGFTVHASTRQHPKISHPNRPGIRRAIPGTPSDHRAYLNLVAQLRNEFGIDITVPTT